MTWDDFSPFVLPYAPGCPDATVEHHVRMAAIEFCRHTNVWQANLAPLVANGALTAFTMVRPTDAEVSKLLGVSIRDGVLAPVEAAVVNAMDGAQRIRDSSLKPIAFTGDLRGLVVWPAQAINAAITAYVALKPTITAATFPDDLFAHHANDIAKGALGTILAMANQDWTDQKGAAMNTATFNSRKSTLARTVERGFAKSTRRSVTRWF